jgi:hypothetical protein
MIQTAIGLKKPIERYIELYGTPELKEQKLTEGDWNELKQVQNSCHFYI